MELEDAIKLLENWVKEDRTLRDNSLESDFDVFCEEKNIAIETVLNALERWEKLIDDLEDDVSIAMHEIDKKDKIIDLMAENIYGSDTVFYLKNVNSVEEVKEYYKKKAGKV